MNKDLDEGGGGSGDGEDDGDGGGDDYVADGATQGGTVNDLEKYM